MKRVIEGKVNSFEGQEFFIGLDVHLRNFKVTIRNNMRELKTYSMDADPIILSNYLSRNYPGGIYYSVYEAGYCGFWIDRKLRCLGIKNIVVNPADIPTTDKEKRTKTDVVDSRKLARCLENHELVGIYVPTEYEESLRNLSRTRQELVKEQTRVKNRIKSYLSTQGIKLPQNCEIRHWSGRFIEFIGSIRFKEELSNYRLEKLLEQLLIYRARILEVLRKIRSIANGNEILRLLQTIPGIGIIVAFTLYSELNNMERFPNEDKLAAMVGLVPDISSSDEKLTRNKLTKRSKKYLRSLLIESAWKAVSIDPALTLAYNNYCKTMVPTRAIIRIARKLLRRIRSVWVNKRAYEICIIEN